MKIINQSFLKIILIALTFFVEGTTFSAVLITSLYNEQNAGRIKEYLSCLEKNLSNPFIDTIHVLYDTNKDEGSKTIYEYLLKKKIAITLITGKPSFQYCFDLAQITYPNQTIILSNADICFDETLLRLSNLDLKNRVVALTRMNYQNKIWDHERISFIHNVSPSWLYKYAICNYMSADSWIFNSSLAVKNCDTILLGSCQCDGLLAIQLFRNGINLINLTKDVHSFHVHKSGVRDYEKKYFFDWTQMPEVPWKSIKDYQRTGCSGTNKYCKLTIIVPVKGSAIELQHFFMELKKDPYFSDYQLLFLYSKSQSQIEKIVTNISAVYSNVSSLGFDDSVCSDRQLIEGMHQAKGEYITKVETTMFFARYAFDLLTSLLRDFSLLSVIYAGCYQMTFSHRNFYDFYAVYSNNVFGLRATDKFYMWRKKESAINTIKNNETPYNCCQFHNKILYGAFAEYGALKIVSTKIALPSDGNNEDMQLRNILAEYYGFDACNEHCFEPIFFKHSNDPQVLIYKEKMRKRLQGSARV